MADEVVEETVDEEAVSETAEAPADESTESSIADDLTLGGGAPADQDAEPATASTIRGKIDKFGVAMGTGRRKTSVARVRIKDGSGEFTVNGRPLADYFQLERDQQAVQAPLASTQTAGTVDVWIRVNGGGTTGQAGAVVLGIARALQARDPGLHHLLAAGGYLTRDSRMVERKKYGFKKARKSFQFSKR
jgi:small subunit ribosomal protein S9